MSARLRWLAAIIAASLAFAPYRTALALDLMKDLPCAFTQTIHKESGFCLEIHNTCNTPLISRIQERNGDDKDSPEMLSGESAEVCSAAPFVFLGHYVSSGP